MKKKTTTNGAACSAARRQCKTCPWKVTTDPVRDIPGYDVKLARKLTATIAPAASFEGFGGTQQVMACHYSPTGREVHCVGWLANQLGPGNNLALRLRAMTGEFGRFQLDGDQHERYEDTLPRGRGRKAARR